jgi:hypothetical protein
MPFRCAASGPFGSSVVARPKGITEAVAIKEPAQYIRNPQKIKSLIDRPARRSTLKSGGTAMVRDASWAQLGHVNEVMRHYRALILPGGLPQDRLSELVNSKEALLAQLRDDFLVKNHRRDLVGFMLIWPELEISNEAVRLLNSFSGLIAESRRALANPKVA